MGEIRFAGTWEEARALCEKYDVHKLVTPLHMFALATALMRARKDGEESVRDSESYCSPCDDPGCPEW